MMVAYFCGAYNPHKLTICMQLPPSVPTYMQRMHLVDQSSCYEYTRWGFLTISMLYMKNKMYEWSSHCIGVTRIESMNSIGRNSLESRDVDW